MHDRQGPEDAAVTSDPFGGYNKVNGGEQNLKRISVKWLSWLSVCQWQRYTMLMLFVFVFEVSVVYRILPVCCKFPSGCRCYVLYCQSLYNILQLLVTQTRNDMK